MLPFTRSKQHAREKVGVYKISILLSERCKFPVLIILGGERSEYACHGLPSGMGHVPPDINKAFHSWNSLETGITGKNLVSAQTGECDLESRCTRLSGHEICIYAINRGLVHRRKGARNGLESILL